MIQARDVDYRCDEANLRGYLAIDENAVGPRPGVLVFHEGLGLGEFAMERARRLAGLGYVALAADMFGDRRQATNLQEVATLVGGLRAEPEKLRARGRAALTRSPRCRRSMPAGWRRSGSVLAGRWCWSWRARAPT